MEPTDILIVTPYNAQIRAIETALTASGQTACSRMTGAWRGALVAQQVGHTRPFLRLAVVLLRFVGFPPVCS